MNSRGKGWAGLALALLLVLALVVLVGWSSGVTNLTDLHLSGGLNTAAQTSITVTADSTISPAGTYQPISAAGAVGTSSITAGDAGDLLVLTNTGANVITITDTGTLKLSGNAALGQYDSLFLLSDGTNWVEIGEGAN